MNVTTERDLIVDAKRLVLEGLVEPGIVTARVALERSLRRMVFRKGLPADVANRIGAGRLARALKDAGRISEKLLREVVEINSSLSYVAHGGEVNLHRAVRLIERAEVVRRKVEKLVERR